MWPAGTPRDEGCPASSGHADQADDRFPAGRALNSNVPSSLQVTHCFSQQSPLTWGQERHGGQPGAPARPRRCPRPSVGTRQRAGTRRTLGVWGGGPALGTRGALQLRAPWGGSGSQGGGCRLTLPPALGVAGPEGSLLPAERPRARAAAPLPTRTSGLRPRRARPQMRVCGSSQGRPTRMSPQTGRGLCPAISRLPLPASGFLSREPVSPAEVPASPPRVGSALPTPGLLVGLGTLPCVPSSSLSCRHGARQQPCWRRRQHVGTTAGAKQTRR